MTAQAQIHQDFLKLFKLRFEFFSRIKLSAIEGDLRSNRSANRKME